MKRIDQLQRMKKEALLHALMSTEQELANLKKTFEEFEGAVYRSSRLAMRYKELLAKAESELRANEKKA